MKVWVLSAAIGLGACSGESANTGATSAPAGTQADLGARIYSQNCVPCHREDGAGVPSVYPGLAHSPVVNGDPKELTQWVLSGKRPPSIPAGRYSTQMLLFGWLKDADAAALLTYVRSSFGNSSPAVDAAAVAAAR
jgi:mono/diheme cytochrome c family protein